MKKHHLIDAQPILDELHESLAWLEKHINDLTVDEFVEQQAMCMTMLHLIKSQPMINIYIDDDDLYIDEEG